MDCQKCCSYDTDYKCISCKKLICYHCLYHGGCDICIEELCVGCVMFVFTFLKSYDYAIVCYPCINHKISFSTNVSVRCFKNKKPLFISFNGIYNFKTLDSMDYQVSPPLLKNLKFIL